MQFIINKITQAIMDREPEQNGEAIILINGFDNLSIYTKLCCEIDALYHSSTLSYNLKLAKRKWEELKKSADTTDVQLMENRGWVADKESVTYYRNLHCTNLLILLGTEDEEDTGGLMNCFTITPDWIIKDLGNRYHQIFADCFINDLTEDEKSTIDAAYRSLFTYVPINICKLSDFADRWTNCFSTINDFCMDFGESLSEWGLPGWFSKPLSPQALRKSNFLKDNYNFISRKQFQRISRRNYSGIENRLNQYKEEGHDVETDWAIYGFQDYGEFKDCILAFTCGDNVSKNRERLLHFDFAIIQKILSYREKTDRKSSRQVTITGQPIEVFLNAAIRMMKQAALFEIDDLSEIHFSFKSVEIVTGFTDIDDNEKQLLLAETWRNICIHVNGVFEFVNQNEWILGKNIVKLVCEDESLFDPKQVGNYLGNIVNVASGTNTLNKVNFYVCAYDTQNNPIMIEENDSLQEFSFDYNWKFENDASWCYDFRDLAFCDYPVGARKIPVGIMKHIRNTMLSKSEQEFFDVYDEDAPVYELDMQQYVSEHIHSSDPAVIEIEMRFEELGKAFCEFARNLKDKGIYYCFMDESKNSLIEKYNNLSTTIIKHEFADNDQWIKDAFLQSFTILERGDYIANEEEPSCVIIPPWHPAALQKISDQKRFIVDGLNQTVNGLNRATYRATNIDNLIDHFMRMTEIQSAIDIFPSKGNDYIGVMGSYGNFCLYGDIKYIQGIKTRMKDIIRKEAIYDDEFKASALTKMNDDAKMFFDIFMDYIKAMPSVKDSLKIVFINPSDLQPIIAAVSKYTDTIRKDRDVEKIDLRLSILVRPENKGGKNYLSYWMNDYFSEDEDVNVRVYLNEWRQKSDLQKLVSDNNDIVINMDLMHEESFRFIPNANSIDMKISECRFPIVYKPTPVSKTSKKRKIELSQPQFTASFNHTQVARYTKNADVVPDGTFLAVRESNVDLNTRQIIEMLHEKAYWVVCIDKVMDGALLRDESGSDSYSIIGFSTGKGMYGQYNLTITARNSIRNTIRKKLRDRLYRLFKWDSDVLDKAVDRVMAEARSLDGISIFSAINQKGTNINEFMAYVMTSLRSAKEETNSALKVIIHLDSYKHWFNNSDKDDKSMRPDFLILSVGGEKSKLKIKAKIIECKTASYHNYDTHIEKALRQVDHGRKQLSRLFDPESDSIERRYWYAQLYRALVFAQITFANNSKEYKELSEKLRSILDGNFEIEWECGIIGFWVDLPGERESFDHVNGITIYNIPQEGIQNLLLGSTNSEFVDVDAELMAAIEDDDDDLNYAKAENQIQIEKYRVNTRTRRELKDENEKRQKDKEHRDNQPIDHSVNGENNNQNTDVEEVKEIETEIHQKPQDTESSDIVENENGSSIQEDNHLENIRVLIGKDRLNYGVFWEFGNKGLSNRHLLITGTSGQGKTYGIQTMLYEISKTSISTVVFDYTEGFRLDQLEHKFIDKMQGRIDNRIVYFTGVPINPFKRHEIEVAGMRAPEKISDVAQRIAATLSHVYGFGDQQFAAIYDACRTGMEKYGDAMSMNKLEQELNESSNKSAKSVVSKMSPFVHSVEFSETECEWDNILYNETGRLTIFQLTNFVRDIQVIITEFMLWDMWHYAKKNGNKDKPFIVVLDEAQNLSHAANSPSGLILTEGRKFGWSAWYATQSLRVLNDDEITRLMQAGFKLNFKPTASEIISMAKQLNPTDVNEWRNPLINLKKGECIVVGDRIQRDGIFKPGKPTITKVTPFEER